MNKFTFTLLALIMVSAIGWAQPPNDTFSGAVTNNVTITPDPQGAPTTMTLPFSTDGTTDSGMSSTCIGTNSGLDQFFRWTATSPALLWNDLSPGNPGIAIYDEATMAEIDCVSTFAANDINLSGWSVGDNLVIQIMDFAGSTSDVAFELSEISCPDPSNIAVSNISTTTADVSWTDNAGTGQAAIEYGPAGFTPGNGTTVQTGSGSPVQIDRLSPQTDYDVYVTTGCLPNNGQSNQVGPVSFTTACATVVAPISEDFEAFSSGQLNGSDCWLDVGVDGFDWRVDTSGSTPSSDTGPSGAFSGTNYIFTESSGPTAGDIAKVQPPAIDLSALVAPQLVFQYFMYGDDIGDFRVMVSNDGGATFTEELLISGQQQTSPSDSWALATVDLSAYSGNTVIISLEHTLGAQVGSFSYNGDVAIDDFQIRETPSCLEPTMLTVASVTETTADVSWTDNAGSGQAEVFYGPAGFDPATQGLSVQVSGTSVTLSSLSSNTAYDFYVQSDCTANGNGVSTTSSPASFTTLCGIQALPFYEDVEGNTARCWEFIDANNDGDTFSINTSSTFAQSGSQSFQAYTDFNSGANDDYLVSPQVTLTGNERFRFSYRVRSSSEPDVFEVLLSTTDTDPASFTNVVLPAATYSNTSFAEVTVDLSAFTGDAYVAIHMPASTTDGWYMYFDDLYIEDIPSCLEPSDLMAGTVTDTTADISWTDNSGSGVANVIYGTAGFDPNTQGTTVPVTGTSYQITSLTAETDYDFYVQSDCSANGLSTLAGPEAFTTTCAPIAAPYVEGFNGSTSIPACWDEFGSDSWKFSQSAGYDASNAENLPSARGGNFAWIDGSGTSGATVKTTLVSPLIDVSALTAPELRFFLFSHYGAGMTTYNLFEVEAFDPSNSTWVNVYTNQSDLGNTWNSITVDLTPYVSASNLVQVRFSVTENGAPNAYNNDILIDDVEFRETPTCTAPTMVQVTAVSDTTVDLSWTDTSGSGVANVIYGTAGFDPNTGGTTVSATGTTATINNLMPATDYEFYVQSDCTATGDGLSALSVPVSMTTSCTGLTVTFTEGFEDAAIEGQEPCWRTISNTTATNTQLHVDDDDVNTGTQAYQFYSGSDASAELILISPQLTDLAADKRVSFFVYDEDLVGLEVGTMSNPLDASTFTVFQTFTEGDLPDDTWVERTVDFVGLTGTDQFIAFRPIFGGTFDDIFIDDVTYTTQPSCVEAVSLTVDAVFDTSANVSWTDNAGSGQANVIYGPAGFDPQTTGTTQAVTGTSTTLSSLMAETAYDFYVQSDCTGSSNGLAALSSVQSFTTDCAALVAPYVETFSTDTLPTCWSESGDNAWEYGNDVTNPTGQAAYAAEFVPDHTSTEDGTFIFMDGSNNGDGAVSTVTTAPVDVTGLVNPEVSFWVFSNNTNDSAENILTVEFFDGASWSTVETIQGNLGTDWVNYTVDLTGASNLGFIKLRFTVTGNANGGSTFYNDILIDDVAFKEAAFRYNGTAWNTNPVGISGMNDEVYVEAGTVQLTGALTTGLLNVSDGATLDLNGFDAVVMGNMNVSGNVIGSGEVSLEGAAAQRISSNGDGIVSNLTVNNANGVEINPGSISVSEILTLLAGDLTTNDALTLMSDMNQTAMLAPLGATASLTDDVTVERYVPGKYVWRFMTTPITTTSSIRSNWQNGGVDTPNVDTHITGQGGSSNGFDETFSNNPSMFGWDNIAQTWTEVTATNTGGMAAATPYRIFIRGDRTWDLDLPDPNTGTPQPTVMSSTGTLTTGSVTIPNMGDAAGDFGFIGNPYMAPVDMQTVLASSTNLNTGFYFVWDPTAGSQGAYTTYTFGSGNSLMGSAVDGTMRSSQAVFVQVATGGGSSITFNESDIVTSTMNIGVFSDNESPSLMNIGVYAAGDDRTGVARDGVMVSFDVDGINALDVKDAGKLTNPDENLAVLIDGQVSSVSSRALPQHGDIIALDMSGYTSSDNVFVAQLGSFEEGITAYFVDGLTGERTELAQDGRTEIPVQVDMNNAGSVNSRRFYVEFAKDGFASEQFASQISMYPNPITGDELNIMLPKTDAESISVEVVNMLGQTVLTSSFDKTGANATVSGISRLETGVYIVTITDGKETATERLVVK